MIASSKLDTPGLVPDRVHASLKVLKIRSPRESHDRLNKSGAVKTIKPIEIILIVLPAESFAKGIPQIATPEKHPGGPVHSHR